MGAICVLYYDLFRFRGDLKGIVYSGRFLKGKVGFERYSLFGDEVLCRRGCYDFLRGGVLLARSANVTVKSLNARTGQLELTFRDGCYRRNELQLLPVARSRVVYYVYEQKF